MVEAALAHTEQNPTEAAYARSDLFERRRRLMDDWAAYLSGTRGQVWHDDGNRASRPGVLPTLQPTSRQPSKAVPVTGTAQPHTPRPVRYKSFQCQADSWTTARRVDRLAKNR